MKIAGRLLADLHAKGTVRIVFIAHVGGGNECPVTARTLTGAEIIFLACGLTPKRAAALREELERNKGIGVETAMDESVAAKFRPCVGCGHTKTGTTQSMKSSPLIIGYHSYDSALFGHLLSTGSTAQLRSVPLTPRCE